MSPAKLTVFCFIRPADAEELQDIMKFFNWRRIADLTAVLFTVLSTSTAAQDQEQSQQQLGAVAESAAGKVGQRETREQAQSNIEPMARINNRVPNRIQNRIRNRIDRYYNPQANVTSPFDVAAEEVRKAGAQTPR